MALRKRMEFETFLSDEERAQLLGSVQVLSREEIDVYRGSERSAMISIASPGNGNLSMRAIRLLGRCAIRRGEGTQFPQAVRLLKGGLPGYILIQPVAAYDPLASDQQPIRWYRNFRNAACNLLLALQPIGHEVPGGQIAEMPISLETDATGASYLVIHAAKSRMRSAKREAPLGEQ